MPECQNSTDCSVNGFCVIDDKQGNGGCSKCPNGMNDDLGLAKTCDDLGLNPKAKQECKSTCEGQYHCKI